MPIYEYECRSCGKTFEKMVSFSETDKKVECPECDSQETQKRISMFASKLSGNSSTPSSGGCASRPGSRFT